MEISLARSILNFDVPVGPFHCAIFEKNPSADPEL